MFKRLLRSKEFRLWKHAYLSATVAVPGAHAAKRAPGAGPSDDVLWPLHFGCFVAVGLEVLAVSHCRRSRRLRLQPNPERNEGLIVSLVHGTMQRGAIGAGPIKLILMFTASLLPRHFSSIDAESQHRHIKSILSVHRLVVVIFLRCGRSPFS